MSEPLSEVRDISRLAYGFLASKALFAALNLELFGQSPRVRHHPRRWWMRPACRSTDSKH